MAARSSALSRVVCADCLSRLSGLDGEALAREVVTPTVVPASLGCTHTLCRACLSVHQIGDRHPSHCALLAAGVELTAAGWASGLSEALRDDLRRARPVGLNITARLVASMAQRALAAFDAERSSTIVVAVPTGGRGASDPLGRLAVAAAELLGVPAIGRAIKRDKRESTRESVAQARARIARTEYALVEESTASLRGRAVVLIDDTVTTGNTLAALALLLRSVGAAAVLPVAIDRTASPRLLQRAAPRAPDQCPHLASDGATQQAVSGFSRRSGR